MMVTRILTLSAVSANASRLAGALQRRGYRTEARSTLDEAAQALSEGGFAVAIVAGDRGAEPAEICRRLGAVASGVSLIVLAGGASVPAVVDALRAGASEYVIEPDDVESVVAAVERVLESRALREQLRALSAVECEPDSRGPELVGVSQAMEQVRVRVARAADSNATVLITGESGTGKEVVALTLHAQSRRTGRPFVAINCAAIPHHLFESELFGHARGAFTGADHARTGLLVEAGDGTVFLDEVGAMPLSAQAKLLRALQERVVRPLGQEREVAFAARMIAASNLDLSAEVDAGRLRDDLFFRLNVIRIRLPPLRERGKDVLLLAQHFIERYSARAEKHIVGLTPGAARTLLSHRWPGNVRELQNWIEAAVVHARYDHITESDLPMDRYRALSGTEDEAADIASLDAVEGMHIAAVLRSVAGNKAAAARLLGVDKKTLYRKLERYRLGDDGAR